MATQSFCNEVLYCMDCCGQADELIDDGFFTPSCFNGCSNDGCLDSSNQGSCLLGETFQDPGIGIISVPFRIPGIDTVVDRYFTLS